MNPTAMDQRWFEMADIRKRRFDSAVWIPLRASERSKTGKWGHMGYKSEFFGAGSLAVPIRKRAAAEGLGWTDLGLMHDHCGYADHGRYVAADEYNDRQLKGAVPLVMSQRGNSAEPPTWHMHPDLVVTLGLKREGNVWLAMDEGYIEVIRLKLDEDNNRPRLMEVRAEYLKDYLCARRMALRLSWYRERQEVMEEDPTFNWPKPDGTYKDGERWEGRVDAIHEGGEWFGSSMAVLHVTRPNLDFDEDVPRIGVSDDLETSSFTGRVSEGRKLYRVVGEVWRDEWVEPGARSTRIRRDEPYPPVAFVVDADGKKQAAKNLIDSGRWLWFKPEVVPALIERRGGSLEWYTRETGRVKGSPDYGIHFGINSLGLVNAYAKDVALLPEWLRRLWVGFNISPEGKVAAELLSSQAEGIPASTQAPEPFLPVGMAVLNEAFEQRFGKALFRPPASAEAFKACHRFKALSESSLYGLAKDLVRLVVEHIDAAMLHQIVAPPSGETWRSLKSLEKVLATVTGAEWARSALGPLHGIYNLRLADAHVPSNDLDEAYALARVDRTLPFVMQGRDLLITCVTCLHVIAKAITR
ncbi:MAG TPA: hypothetical protein VJN48_05625 [Terriglobales bacterium]|nr:hypothetical protein [Terriglobales bacterium]